MVLIESSQIMTFEQSEKPRLQPKLAHEPARQAQAQTPLVLAIYLLSHSLQSPELLCPRNGSPDKQSAKRWSHTNDCAAGRLEAPIYLDAAHAAGKVHAPRR
jgi:hypothetical protein